VEELYMGRKTYTIGIVCSGNTCRSPVTAAWLQEAINQLGNDKNVTVWTAGMRVEKNDVANSSVEDYVLCVADEMKMSELQINRLREHRVRDLHEETNPTDLLVWITDPNKLMDKVEGDETRAAFMKKRATDLGAILLVVPEADNAWEAKENKKPRDEVLRLYYEQANKLKEWSLVIH
jgi:protein-tyrosine-phosphatase